MHPSAEQTPSRHGASAGHSINPVLPGSVKVIIGEPAAPAARRGPQRPGCGERIHHRYSERLFLFQGKSPGQYCTSCRSPRSDSYRSGCRRILHRTYGSPARTGSRSMMSVRRNPAQPLPVSRQRAIQKTTRLQRRRCLVARQLARMRYRTLRSTAPRRFSIPALGLYCTAEGIPPVTDRLLVKAAAPGRAILRYGDRCYECPVHRDNPGEVRDRTGCGRYGIAVPGLPRCSGAC